MTGDASDVELAGAGGAAGASAPALPVSEDFSITLSFRRLAWTLLGLFLGLTAVTGIVTFTATDYSPDIDLITRYFGTFNPCIFYDHYPSNVVGLVSIVVYALVSVLWVVTLFLYVSLLRDAPLLLGSALPLAFRAVAEIVFPDVFATDLYGPDDPVVVDGEPVPLTLQNTRKVRLHTAFYILWLMGHVASMLVVYRVVRYTRRGAIRWWWTALYFLGVAAVFVGGITMLTYLSTWTPQGSWEDNPRGFVQHTLKAIRKTRLAVWHWVPTFVYPFVLRADRGVVLSFTGAQPRDRGSVSPHGLLSAAFKVVGVGVLFAYLLQTPSQAPNTRMVLTAGFLEEPYRFYFLPMFVVATFLVGCSVVLAAYQAAASHPARWRSPRAACVCGCGGLLVADMVLCTLVVIEDLNTGGFQSVVFVGLFVPWTLLTSGVSWRSLLYVSLWVGAAGGSTSEDPDTAAGFNGVLIFLLVAFNVLAPTGPGSTVRVEVTMAAPLDAEPKAA